MARDPGTGTDNVNTVTEQVKTGAQQVVDQAQQTAGQVVDQAQHQATSMMESQKGRASGTLNEAARALRQTGDQLQDQGPAGQALQQASQQIERLAGYLDSHDVDEIVAEVEGFARREPGVFLGGAFIIGFIASRFLKSSPQPAQQGGYSYGSMYSRRPPYAYDEVSGIPPVRFDGSESSRSQYGSGSYGSAYANGPSGLGDTDAEGPGSAYTQSVRAGNQAYGESRSSSTDLSQSLPELPEEERRDTSKDVGI